MIRRERAKVLLIKVVIIIKKAAKAARIEAEQCDSAHYSLYSRSVAISMMPLDNAINIRTTIMTTIRTTMSYIAKLRFILIAAGSS
jgi:hypothetical protein